MRNGPRRKGDWIFAGELFPVVQLEHVDRVLTVEDEEPRIADYCWLFLKQCHRKDACSIRSKSFHKLACKEGVVLQ